MAKWTGYFKVVQPKPTTEVISSNQDVTGGGEYGNYTWYQRLVQGSSTRLTRYKEYDMMDQDVEVARALDTIAEEMTGNNDRTDLPVDLDMQIEEGQQVPSSTVMTLRTALRHWCDMHDWENRLFKVARNTVKYGDIFFRKGGQHKRWEYIHPKSVLAALVNQNDVTKVDGWQVKVGIKKANAGSSAGIRSASNNTYQTELVPSADMVRFSLNDDMSPSAPFGESILRSVFKAHRQKELLEDAIIIYRVQRAPERRVFYIDVGKMPPQRSKQYLEQIKNEIRQKKIPTNVNGKDAIDSVYNPQSMSEDFFFACLSMKTKVDLLDGRSLTIDELREEYEAGKENWTYSVDQSTGKLIPGKIDWAGFTRRNAEMVRVYLDNGETIDATPDHKFVLKDSTEVEAQYLTHDMCLMPLYKKKVRTNKNQTNATYEMVLDNATGKWKFTHLEIMPKTRDGTVVHHCDYDPCNNTPTNLLEMNKQYHWALHFKNSHVLGKLWKYIRQKMLGGIRRYRANRTPEQDTRHAGFDKLADFKTNYSFNRKVVKVEKLSHREDTGCLHVIDDDDNHNFALSAGVYVKNSRPDGRGSRVETLPGGQGLGELADLEYFQDKVFRGLRVPISWMKSSAENAIFNDGKVGTAYIEELRFALYVMRLQGHIETVLDQEFKRFLRNTNIHIDETLYKIKLPEPSNFGVYRQQEVDAQLLSSYSTADGIAHLSKRFILKRYLQLKEDEILMNERLLREEKGLDPDGEDDLPTVYNPETAGLGEGELGGSEGGAMTAGGGEGGEGGEGGLGL